MNDMLNSSYMSSTSSSIMNNPNFVKPQDINKISIRSKNPQISIQIPFLQNADRNVYIDTFSVYDTTPTVNQDTGKQFLLFCDNANGFYKFNGKQTLMAAISNWDGDVNKQSYSLLSQVPFQLKRGDNLINFVITQSGSSDTNFYPNENEGSQIPYQNDVSAQYIFNLVLNIIEDV